MKVWIHPQKQNKLQRENIDKLNIFFSTKYVLLYSCTPLLLYSYTPVLLYSCTPVPLHSCTPVLLYSCTPVPLRSCTPVLQYSCIPVLQLNVRGSRSPSISSSGSDSSATKVDPAKRTIPPAGWWCDPPGSMAPACPSSSIPPHLLVTKSPVDVFLFAPCMSLHSL